MSNQDFLKQLSDQLEPVKVQSSPIKLATKCLLLMLILVLILLVFISFRRDLHAQFNDSIFILEILNTLFLTLSSLVIIGWTTNPGRKSEFFYKVLNVINLFLLILLNGYRISMNPIPFFHVNHTMVDFKCFMTVTNFALLFGAILFYVVKKRVVTNALFVGAFIGIASAASGSFAISLHCAVPGFVHISLYHFLLPITVSGVMGALGGKLFLKW